MEKLVRMQYNVWFPECAWNKCFYKHTENTMVCNQVFCMTYDRLTIILLSTVTPVNQLGYTSQLYLMVKHDDHSMVALNDITTSKTLLSAYETALSEISIWHLYMH